MTDPIKNLRLALYPVGDVTQWFGENPTLYKPLELAGHNGIDIVRPWGERLYAVESGTIVEVKADPRGYGRHVRLINDACTREWTYGHLAAFRVKQNQRVEEGELIALMGNTGFVVSGDTPFWGTNPSKGTAHPGTHCHFGLRLIEKSRKGWKYPGSSIRMDVLNYGNGFKGAIDPVPHLHDPKLTSTKAERLAREKSSTFYMNISLSLRNAGY